MFEQQLENLLATLPTPRGAAPAPPSHCPLPPVESCGGCYVRTRGDILLAVVKKDELLQCEDEIGLRALKAAALPARITVNARGFSISCHVARRGLTTSYVFVWYGVNNATAERRDDTASLRVSELITDVECTRQKLLRAESLNAQSKFALKSRHIPRQLILGIKSCGLAGPFVLMQVPMHHRVPAQDFQDGASIVTHFSRSCAFYQVPCSCALPFNTEYRQEQPWRKEHASLWAAEYCLVTGREKV